MGVLFEVIASGYLFLFSVLVSVLVSAGASAVYATDFLIIPDAELLSHKIWYYYYYYYYYDLHR